MPHEAKVQKACSACGLAVATEQMNLPGDPKPEREWFQYNVCIACGTLSLATPLISISDYYPDNYYSFGEANRQPSMLKKLRDRFSLWGAGPLTSLMDGFSVNPRLRAIRPLFNGALEKRYGRDHRFIDMGCGDGALLREMATLGFSNLVGVDPYMRKPVDELGLSLKRCAIDEVTGSYDVMMLHHALEHIPEPHLLLEKLHDFLAPRGVLLVRIPVVGRWASREFGEEWIQLDPPRHVTVFSEKGFRMLATRTRWRIGKVIYDSGSLQFAGSLLRQRQIDIHAHPNVIAEHFSRREIREFENRAAVLNAEGEGDQAAFFLYREQHDCGAGAAGTSL